MHAQILRWKDRFALFAEKHGFVVQIHMEQFFKVVEIKIQIQEIKIEIFQK